jgi:hypothetical protein
LLLSAYAFLDPRKEHAKLAAYIIGIPIGEIIVFATVRGLIVRRERWAVKHGRVLKVSEKEGHDGPWMVRCRCEFERPLE